MNFCRLQTKDHKLRSSLPEVFCKKAVLRNFAKFTGKHLCQSLLSNKVAGLRPATLLKKRLGHSCFPVNFAKFLRAPFLKEHPRWLLLIDTKISILDARWCRGYASTVSMFHFFFCGTLFILHFFNIKNC